MSVNSRRLHVAKAVNPQKINIRVEGNRVNIIPGMETNAWDSIAEAIIIAKKMKQENQKYFFDLNLGGIIFAIDEESIQTAIFDEWRDKKLIIDTERKEKKVHLKNRCDLSQSQDIPPQINKGEE